MKKKFFAITLALTLAVGLGITTYAATNTTAAKNYCYGTGHGTGTGLGRLTGFRGFDIITNLLKGKGLTDEQITNSLNSGKTLNNLAAEQGITNDQLKESILEQKIKLIDDAVAKGTMTKEQGDAFKASIKENISNCTTPGQMNGRMGGQNRGSGCMHN